MRGRLMPVAARSKVIHFLDFKAIPGGAARYFQCGVTSQKCLNGPQVSWILLRPINIKIANEHVMFPYYGFRSVNRHTFPTGDGSFRALSRKAGGNPKAFLRPPPFKDKIVTERLQFVSDWREIKL